MKTKICIKCKQENGITCFSKDKPRIDGLSPHCKKCRSEMRKVDYSKKTCPVCKKNFKPKMIDSLTCGNSKCACKLSKDTNKERVLLYNKKYYIENRETESARSKEYQQKNKVVVYQQHKDYHEKWRAINKDRIRGYRNKEVRNKYEVDRKKNDISYRITCILRKQLNKVVGGYKNKSALKLLGCSIKEFKDYLISTFQDNMSFENYGKWHIDHILPCSAFELQYSEEQEVCFHYSNLQALWAGDNLAKSNKIL